MAEKKKTPVTKSIEKRMDVRPAAAKTQELPRTAVSSRSGAAAAPQPADGQRQLAAFEAAMRLFHARSLSEARDLFRSAAEGPERDVAQRARLHIAMCDRRLEQHAVTLRTAEDYYNYGVALINSRDIPAARQHLVQALELAPESDHIHYALAVALALGGDIAGAHESMKRAIELEPRNRLIARQDADLSQVAGHPPFDALLYPERKSW